MFFQTFKRVKHSNHQTPKPPPTFHSFVLPLLFKSNKVELERLDKILINRGLVSTRVRAEELIKETGVLVEGKLFTKPGKKFPADVQLELLGQELQYVSRGALKLEKALDLWEINPTGKTVMDIGACTGGFTELVLERGALKVFAVDVGRDQLAQKLKDDSRVINLEKTHVRELNTKLIPEMTQLCVVDVSFISLEKVLPFIHSFMEENADLVLLVKPQFEVGKENISKGGIVKDVKLYPGVIDKVKKLAGLSNFVYQDHTESPILGGNGNREFLMHLKRK